MMCISEFCLVAFVELLFAMEGQFIGGANIGSEVTRVVFLSLNFRDNISQVLNLFLEFRIHV